MDIWKSDNEPRPHKLQHHWEQPVKTNAGLKSSKGIIIIIIFIGLEGKLIY